MASSRAFFIAIILAAVVAPSLATDYTVGDNDGWKLGVDYTKWATGKDFRVGDTIKFMYAPGSHNILKVNGPDFQQCTSTNASSIPMTSGNDIITLANPGRKWYICDIGNHCRQGMKLVITVSAVEAPTPAPVSGGPSTSTASEISASKYCVWMLIALTASGMMMA
ncbi:hypothetical protein ACJIZ3_004054 [Penstemon smallii]|uniref:Phytocyanin domain-containing protein n=1 Tax=Penstemon smallii TaxID=265156 RepID=A0ABD3S0Y5_9LAMI